MSINCRNALVCSSLEKFTCDDLLNRQYNTVFASDSNGRAAVLYRLDRILDLEVPSIGREDRIGEIITRTY